MTAFMLIIAISLWGASFIFTKLCLEFLTPMEIVASRFILAVPVLLLISWKKKLSFRFFTQRWKIVIVCSLVLIAHLLIQVEGMKTTTATNTAWLITTIPIFIVAFSFFFLKERMKVRQLLGVAVAAFGVFVLVSRGNLTSLEFISSYGDWMVLVSCITWSVYTILGKKLSDTSPLAVTTLVLTIAALGVCPPVFIHSGISKFATLPAKVIYSLIFLGVLCMGIAYWLWTEALKRKTAGQVGVYLYFEPITTMLIAPFVLNEAITSSLLAGGALVIIGVWLVEKKRDLIPWRRKIRLQ
ncbi:MAG: DMT family transporter [Candidatus Zixiibacteriota bacterium]